MRRQVQNLPPVGLSVVEHLHAITFDETDVRALASCVIVEGNDDFVGPLRVSCVNKKK